ncbi:MAG: tyrosine-type recombinase/integrase [Actinomycetes bacterium]
MSPRSGLSDASSGRRGSVKQSANGSWFFVVDTTPLGSLHRMQTRRRGFATRRAAQSALTQTLRELGDQTYVAPQRQSLGDFLQVTWLPAIRSTVRPSTYDSYARNIRIHVAPKPVAGIPIQQIQPPMLNALYSELLAGESRRALSPRTVSYIHTILHRVFRDAVRWNLLIRNPCDLADPPRARPSEQVRERTWTSGEVARFLRLTTSSRYSALWHLIAATGMRRGEALGLSWDDVDLVAGRLSINRTLVQSHDYASGDTGLSWGTPKTARGRRAISIDPDTVAALRAHRKAQLAERLRAGDDYSVNDLVFCTGSGEPLHPKVASNLFRKAVIQHEMPRLSVHGLRHTWATLALQAGVHPKIVQERLGHSTIAITLDIYSHVNPAMDAEAANTVAALFREQG